MKNKPSIIGASPLETPTPSTRSAPLAEAADVRPPGLSDLALEEADERLLVERRHYTIGPELHGLRLDRALAVLVPEFSRSYLQQLIEEGALQLGGHAITRSAYRVRAGQAGEIELRATPQSQAFVPEAMALDVVYEDAHLRVINKPAGLVVHPAPGHWRGTLLNGLLALDPAASQLPRAGIVHRLDKDTSGLMVVARDRVTMEALVRLIAAREVSRHYLALAHRPWQGPSPREVEAPIGRDPAQRLRMAVVDLARAPGKPAATGFECLGQGGPGGSGSTAPAGCLLRATLRTGRTHQIRVHAAHIGHPLVGDALYGGAPAAGMTRQALHAFQLAFRHPADGRAMQFQVPPPQDLLDALAAWGLGYNEPALG